MTEPISGMDDCCPFWKADERGHTPTCGTLLLADTSCPNCTSAFLQRRVKLCLPFCFCLLWRFLSISASVCSVALSLFIALKVTIDQIVSTLQLQPWMGRKRNWLQSIQQQIELYWLVPYSCRRGALLPFNYHGYPFPASMEWLDARMGMWGDNMALRKVFGCTWGLSLFWAARTTRDERTSAGWLVRNPGDKSLSSVYSDSSWRSLCHWKWFIFHSGSQPLSRQCQSAEEVAATGDRRVLLRWTGHIWQERQRFTW